MRKLLVLCDLDDDADRRPGVDIVRVVVDGTERALDVCGEHLAVLRALSPDSAASRPQPAARPAGRDRPSRSRKQGSSPARPAGSRDGKTAGPVSAGRKPGSRRDRQAQIALAREWARSQGRDVAEKGRLPVGLLAEYEKATS